MSASAFYGTPSAFTNPALDKRLGLRLPLLNNGNHWEREMRKRIDAKTGELRVLVRQNIRLAKRWAVGKLGTVAIGRLRELTKTFGFSLGRGDLHYLDSGWYITHAGLLRLARRQRCAGVQVQQVRRFCDPVKGRWVFKATVYTSPQSKGFVGFGDADPSNVSSRVHGAEMRVAETRAVNRALRKAYGIGICSVEELGSFSSSSPAEPCRVLQNGSCPPANPSSGNAQPRLRDRLCLLIRQHRLDPALVKSYAADYCRTAALSEASREMVEAFICHLAEWAGKDRDGLVTKLNSYAKCEVRA
jgi:hypothetical protein